LQRGWTVLFAALAIGCMPDEDAGEQGAAGARIELSAPAALRPDQQCLSLVATRLDDFTSTGYTGPTEGASFTVRPGEHHVAAIAYGGTCDPPPAWSEAPWIADEVVVSFERGQNSLALIFRFQLP